jgi:small subunit ribosomal protein S14
MRGRMIHDRLKRKLVCHAELTRMALRYITHNESLPAKTRLFAQLKLNEMPAATALHRINRRCIITGRGRAVLPEFNINRMRFREMALQGRIFGVTKSSW